MYVDPLAEKFPAWSPYSFCFDNPMKFVDPDGMAPEDWYINIFTRNITWKEGSGEKLGYKNLGYTVGSTDINNNRLLMNGDTKQITYNNKVLYDYEKDKTSIFSIKGGWTVWGEKGRGTSTDGLKGITTDSYNYDDFVGPSGAGPSLSNKFGIIKYILNIIKNYTEAEKHGRGIRDAYDKYKGNNKNTDTIYNIRFQGPNPKEWTDFKLTPSEYKNYDKFTDSIFKSNKSFYNNETIIITEQ